jgi:hypothetical protein
MTDFEVKGHWRYWRWIPPHVRGNKKRLCPICANRVPVNDLGRLAEHVAYPAKGICTGSGRLVR